MGIRPNRTRRHPIRSVSPRGGILESHVFLVIQLCLFSKFSLVDLVSIVSICSLFDLVSLAILVSLVSLSCLSVLVKLVSIGYQRYNFSDIPYPVG